MKNKINKYRGFTLVELLIVIALIAILSVAVLATINPIEQSNKARDAKFKNDTAEVLSAYERYYASQNNYPWNYDHDSSGTVTGIEVTSSTSGIAFLARDDWRFGVVDATDPNGGQLIATSELKSAFAGKEIFNSTNSTSGGVDAAYVYHSGDNNYVCFCPKANANRTGQVGNSLKCLNGITAAGAAAVAGSSTLTNIGDPGCAKNADPKDSNFCNIGTGNASLICVPEGTIN